MQSTMQDFPLTVTHLLRHGRQVHGDGEVLTDEGDHVRRASFPEVAVRAERLAAALARLGIGDGDRVSTFCWNHQEHLEAYLAVPCMGAVLLPLNIRLFQDQLAHVVNHAEVRAIIVDASLVGVLAATAPQFSTVEHYLVLGGEPTEALPAATHSYEALLDVSLPGYRWPDLDERSAAAMCYTTGTTGEPKGVVYSHRSIVLHALSECSGAFFGLSARDRVLMTASMFHATAWGLPYAGWWVGADLIFPGRHLQSGPLSALIAQTRPTVAGAVPTIWMDLLRYGETHPIDLSSFRLLLSGGSAVPQSLIERFQALHGRELVQAWGMTETSPAAAISFPPKGATPETEMHWRAKTGRMLPGVEMRLCDLSGEELPWDGEAIGEIEVRGPWVTSSYYGIEAPDRFHDGWLRTGDVGTIDSLGYVQITDRSKDVIKSGGEWISSVELENLLMGHTDVVEASVIGVTDERWGERPLACVVLREGVVVKADDLCAYLASRVARWWIPERWAVVEAIPKTSVGKFDKVGLRRLYAAGALDVTTVSRPS
jgi:fatty-acyl-CoA synthase